ncbi:hypothetical protein PYW08_004038 [Mythimna loreyi]|uniref:Uncharacterized protein n=1 Tax=Mythimna loreyi TaxID=667449 RepID=A0ACC2QWZ0_9NEOP|nr:hypothetical protein PYW08_004038 [Mythimna loreyi]
MNSSVKAAPMLKDETMRLVQLVAANYTIIINNKATNATNNKMKDDAWKTIASQFNSSVSSFPRTPAQPRLKWDNLKKSARKRCANMRNSNMKTGGGKDYFPPDAVLDKVMSLLSNTCQGLSVEFGGDASIPSMSDLVMGDVMDVAVEGQVNVSDSYDGDSICSGGSEKAEVLKEIKLFETPPSRPENFVLNSGSGTLAKRKLKLQEELAEARIKRDNALADYLLAKKKKLDKENEQKEFIIAKLKLEVKIARLEIQHFKKINRL